MINRVHAINKLRGGVPGKEQCYSLPPKKSNRLLKKCFSGKKIFIQNANFETKNPYFGVI